MIKDAELEVKPGEIYFINSHTPHKFISEDDSLQIYNLILLPTFLKNANVNGEDFINLALSLIYKSIFFEEFSEFPYTKIYDSEMRILKIYDLIYDEYSANRSGRKSIIFALVIELLVYLARIYNDQNKMKLVEKIHHSTMHDVISYIEKNYNKKVTLSELAEIAFMSPNYFCTRFKEITGISVSDYVQEKRVEQACKMLLETDKSFSSIAYEVGYQDETFFRRTFKKHTGKKPSEFRMGV